MDIANSLRVLIVEAEWPLASLLSTALEDEGMITDIVEAGPLAIPHKRLFRPDVVVIGMGLSQPDTLGLVEGFATEGDCGVVVVSPNDVESAYVTSLDMGADDYIVEPVGLLKLAARIRAVHRRLVRNEEAARRTRVRVDMSTRALIGPGPVVSTLTEAEFALLMTLIDAGGGAVSRMWLGRVALKRNLHDDDRSVDQLVLKLRRKLGQHGIGERAILSTRGLGYSVPEPSMFDLPRHTQQPQSPTEISRFGMPRPELDAHRSAGGLQP